MGHMWVWSCHFHYDRYLTVWMNQWQQSNHNKPVCSWLWRLECLRQEQIPDTKGRLKDVAMPVYWWNICWTIAEQLILYCNRFFFFFGHQENVGMCYLLCREKNLLFSLLYWFFCIVWLMSGFTPPPPPHPPGPTGKVPWVSGIDVTSLIMPSVVQQRDSFLCHQTKVLSLSPGKMKLSSPPGNQPFIRLWVILL